MRGSPLTRYELPMLPEAQRSPAESWDSLVERYALGNVQIDRITNSLNTLTKELLHRLQAGWEDTSPCVIRSLVSPSFDPNERFPFFPWLGKSRVVAKGVPRGLRRIVKS